MTRRSAGHAGVCGSVFVLVFAVEVVLVIVFLFIEVDVEPFRDGGEEVVVVAGCGLGMEFVPEVKSSSSSKRLLAPSQAGELCYM